MKKITVAIVISASIAAPALGADMGLPAPAPAYAPSAMLYDWSGFYVGGFGSYTWSHTTSTTTNTASGLSFAPTTINTSAAHGGGQIGLDYMLPSRIVIGIVGDLSSGQRSPLITTVDALGTSTNQSQTTVSGTVRGKLGYAIDRVLLYGTGGWAWSSSQATRTQVSGTVGNATPGTAENANITPEGWTAGGGAAFAITQNLNVFAEYRYTNLKSTAGFQISQRSTSSTSNTNAVEVGLNLEVNWNPVGCYWKERNC
jgi:outer membrane immunogenic protein